MHMHLATAPTTPFNARRHAHAHRTTLTTLSNAERHGRARVMTATTPFDAGWVAHAHGTAPTTPFEAETDELALQNFVSWYEVLRSHLGHPLQASQNSSEFPFYPIHLGHPTRRDSRIHFLINCI